MQPKSKYPSSAAAAGGSKYSSSGAAGVGVPTLMPRTKTQKVSLTDPDTKKTRLLSRSGPAARAIYKKQIMAGVDPAFVLPPELRWIPDEFSESGGRLAQRPPAEIRKRTAYKSYLASYEILNTEELPGNSGFSLNTLTAYPSTQRWKVSWTGVDCRFLRR